MGKAANDRMHGKVKSDSHRSQREIVTSHFAQPHTRDLAVAEIEHAIHSWGLDDKASGLLRALEPEEAVALLQSMQRDVRNPSAFITKAANDRMHGKVHAGRLNPDASRQSHLNDAVDALVQQLGIDERAANVLDELPKQDALGVLERLSQRDTPVNNP